jgi:hypothetical protein
MPNNGFSSDMNKMDNFLKALCFTFLATFLATIDAASAQFEDFPLSVAMDNTEYQFSGFGWEAKSEARRLKAFRLDHLPLQVLPALLLVIKP